MGAFFVNPLPFTVASANQSTIAPASNTNVDEPGLVYRSADLSSPSIVLDLGTGSLSYDTVAIVGTNLRSTDTVRVRTGTTNTGIGSYDNTALAAWSGTLPNGSTAISIYELSSTRTERYVSIGFTATGHPSGYVQAQRIVVGKQVASAGIDWNAEQGFVDQSVAASGAGWNSFDSYPVLSKWKFTQSWISDASWRSDWYPFLQAVGKKRAFLFVPDDTAPTTYQTDACFGRLTSDASGKLPFYNARTLELTMVALAQ